MRNLLCTALLLLFLLPGCGTKAPDQIAPRPLSAEEQDILNLLADDQAVSLFSFEAGKNYQTFSVWVESYRHGEYLGDVSYLTTYADEVDGFSGELAVVFAHSPDARCRLAIREGGVILRSGSEALDTPHGAAWAMGATDEVQVIENGREIALYTVLYASDGALSTYDPAVIATTPSLLEPFDQAYLVKCSFFTGELFVG